MHFSAYRVELTYNYGVDSYPLGDGFGHFGLAVNDVYKTAESIQSSGEFGACAMCSDSGDLPVR